MLLVNRVLVHCTQPAGALAHRVSSAYSHPVPVPALGLPAGTLLQYQPASAWAGFRQERQVTQWPHCRQASVPITWWGTQGSETNWLFSRSAHVSGSAGGPAGGQTVRRGRGSQKQDSRTDLNRSRCPSPQGMAEVGLPPHCGPATSLLRRQTHQSCACWLRHPGRPSASCACTCPCMRMHTLYCILGLGISQTAWCLQQWCLQQGTPRRGGRE